MNEIVVDVDPKYIGPGIWWTLHLSSLNATTEERKTEFRRLLTDVLANLWCKKCRLHASKYIADNPIEEYTQLAHGYFTYMWNFHNTVNKRLGKDEITWETAYKLYTNQLSNVCQHGCDDMDEVGTEIKAHSNNFQDIPINFVSRH